MKSFSLLFCLIIGITNVPAQSGLFNVREIKIEKTYDELRGVLSNHVSVLDVMISQLNLQGVELSRVPLMNKDSLDMSDGDHMLIARTAEAMAAAYDGVIIVHGTDRLQRSGDQTVALMPDPPVPVVFTGAMKPYELRTTDAVQNLTESLLAVQLLTPGVYVAMHNRVLQFPGVIKDTRRGRFVYAHELALQTDGPQPTNEAPS